MIVPMIPPGHKREVTPMLSINCPAHGTKVLIGTRRIRSLVNTEHGIVLHVQCYCGTHVVVGAGRDYASQPISALAA
jgi:hypothetical protein